jgi:hypothetical protein
MKKVYAALLTIAFIAVASFTIININEDSINFSLRYSVDGNDFVSTFDNTLKVDTVAGIKTIDFKFTKKDLERIKNKIIELEIMDTDFREMSNSGVTISTMGIYTLDLEFNGKTKTIY